MMVEVRERAQRANSTIAGTIIRIKSKNLAPAKFLRETHMTAVIDGKNFCASRELVLHPPIEHVPLAARA
jgi:hypothetical protein